MTPEQTYRHALELIRRPHNGDHLHAHDCHACRRAATAQEALDAAKVSPPVDPHPLGARITALLSWLEEQYAENDFKGGLNPMSVEYQRALRFKQLIELVNELRPSDPYHTGTPICIHDGYAGLTSGCPICSAERTSGE